MSENFYFTDTERKENLREILRISYERTNQLKNINNQLLTVLVAVFIGLLTIFINSFASEKSPNVLLIIIMIHIGIGTLLVWRYYSHYIDNELVSYYKRILFCEERLDIPFEISMASWLEKAIEFQLPPPYKDSVELTRKKKYFEQNNTMKNQIIQKLIEKNKSGYRFHNIWDITTGFTIMTLLLYQLFFILINPDTISGDLFFVVTIYTPCAYGFALWALTRDSKNNIPIQRDPTNTELEEIIEETINPSS